MLFSNFSVYFGSLPMTVVHDVEILKEILVKQFTNFSDRYVSVFNAWQRFEKSI